MIDGQLSDRCRSPSGPDARVDDARAAMQLIAGSAERADEGKGSLGIEKRRKAKTTSPTIEKQRMKGEEKRGKGAPSTSRSS